MRIYEVDQTYCIDLGRIAAIRQYVNQTKKKNRDGTPVYDCWIEVIFGSAKSIVIDCNIDNLQDTYDMILAAWRSYVGDSDATFYQNENIMLGSDPYGEEAPEEQIAQGQMTQEQMLYQQQMSMNQMQYQQQMAEEQFDQSLQYQQEQMQTQEEQAFMQQQMHNVSYDNFEGNIE